MQLQHQESGTEQRDGSRTSEEGAERRLRERVELDGALSFPSRDHRPVRNRRQLRKPAFIGRAVPARALPGTRTKTPSGALTRLQTRPRDSLAIARIFPSHAPAFRRRLQAPDRLPCPAAMLSSPCLPALVAKPPPSIGQAFNLPRPAAQFLRRARTSCRHRSTAQVHVAVPAQSVAPHHINLAIGAEHQQKDGSTGRSSRRAICRRRCSSTTLRRYRWNMRRTARVPGFPGDAPRSSQAA